MNYFFSIDKKEGIKVVLDTSDDKYCYHLIANILSIKGNFENGILNGNAVITYTHHAFMNVNFVNGVIQGNDYLFPSPFLYICFRIST